MAQTTLTRRPAATMRPCITCGTPAAGDFCPQHDPHPRGRDHHHGYSRKHWRELRVQRLNLDEHRCQLRVDARCTGTATTVHLDPRLEGNHDVATLNDCRSACLHCHGVVDAPRSRL